MSFGHTTSGFTPNRMRLFYTIGRKISPILNIGEITELRSLNQTLA